MNYKTGALYGLWEAFMWHFQWAHLVVSPSLPVQHDPDRQFLATVSQYILILYISNSRQAASILTV